MYMHVHRIVVERDDGRVIDHKALNIIEADVVGALVADQTSGCVKKQTPPLFSRVLFSKLFLHIARQGYILDR